MVWKGVVLALLFLTAIVTGEEVDRKKSRIAQRISRAINRAENVIKTDSKEWGRPQRVGTCKVSAGVEKIAESLTRNVRTAQTPSFRRGNLIANAATRNLESMFNDATKHMPRAVVNSPKALVDWMTQSHGNYCGPGRGDNSNRKMPIDATDACCQMQNACQRQRFLRYPWAVNLDCCCDKLAVECARKAQLTCSTCECRAAARILELGFGFVLPCACKEYQSPKWTWVSGTRAARACPSLERRSTMECLAGPFALAVASKKDVITFRSDVGGVLGNKPLINDAPRRVAPKPRKPVAPRVPKAPLRNNKIRVPRDQPSKYMPDPGTKLVSPARTFKPCSDESAALGPEDYWWKGQRVSCKEYQRRTRAQDKARRRKLALRAAAKARAQKRKVGGFWQRNKMTEARWRKFLKSKQFFTPLPDPDSQRPNPLTPEPVVQ